MSKLNHNCMFLNQHGDLNISWGEEDHNEMKELILKKMEEGYTFLVIESRFLGLLKTKKILNEKNFNKMINKKEIIVKDKDLDLFMQKAKKASFDRNQGETTYDVKRSLTKEEVVNNSGFNENTSMVALKPAIAG